MSRRLQTLIVITICILFVLSLVWLIRFYIFSPVEIFIPPRQEHTQSPTPATDEMPNVPTRLKTKYQTWKQNPTDEKIKVTVTCLNEQYVPQVKSSIEAKGGIVTAQAYYLIDAIVPIGSIPDVAKLEGVTMLDEPRQPVIQ